MTPLTHQLSNAISGMTPPTHLLHNVIGWVTTSHNTTTSKNECAG